MTKNPFYFGRESNFRLFCACSQIHIFCAVRFIVLPVGSCSVFGHPFDCMANRNDLVTLVTWASSFSLFTHKFMEIRGSSKSARCLSVPLCVYASRSSAYYECVSVPYLCLCYTRLEYFFFGRCKDHVWSSVSFFVSPWTVSVLIWSHINRALCVSV